MYHEEKNILFLAPHVKAWRTQRTNQGRTPFICTLNPHSAHAVSAVSRGHPSLVSLVYILQLMTIPVKLKIFYLFVSLICNWRIFYLLSFSSKASTSFPPTYLSLYVYSSVPLSRAALYFHFRCPLPSHTPPPLNIAQYKNYISSF